MELNDHIGEKEWDDFHPTHDLSPDISGKIWNKINTNTSSPKVSYPYFSWLAVAASVVLVGGLSWLFISKNQKSNGLSAETAVIIKDILNNTPQKKTLTLSDGSTVELLSNSKLSYPENFNSLKRDVLLNGEATFNIAKDVAKPFSVRNNSVIITVLGTRFTVKSDEVNNGTKVILQEGRVMVKITDSSSQDNKKEYYLTPGDIFVFKLSARVLHLEKDKDDCYVFDNYPFDVVFDQLQIIYNTKIIYNKAELGNRTFIGKIDKKDSLPHILKSIALLNKFGLRQQGDSFVISNNPY